MQGLLSLFLINSNAYMVLADRWTSKEIIKQRILTTRNLILRADLSSLVNGREVLLGQYEGRVPGFAIYWESMQSCFQKSPRRETLKSPHLSKKQENWPPALKNKKIIYSFWSVYMM